MQSFLGEFSKGLLPSVNNYVAQQTDQLRNPNKYLPTPEDKLLYHSAKANELANEGLIDRQQVPFVAAYTSGIAPKIQDADMFSKLSQNQVEPSIREAYATNSVVPHLNKTYNRTISKDGRDYNIRSGTDLSQTTGEGKGLFNTNTYYGEKPTIAVTETAQSVKNRNAQSNKRNSVNFGNADSSATLKKVNNNLTGAMQSIIDFRKGLSDFTNSITKSGGGNSLSTTSNNASQSDDVSVYVDKKGNQYYPKDINVVKGEDGKITYKAKDGTALTRISNNNYNDIGNKLNELQKLYAKIINHDVSSNGIEIDSEDLKTKINNLKAQYKALQQAKNTREKQKMVYSLKNMAETLTNNLFNKNKSNFSFIKFDNNGKSTLTAVNKYDTKNNSAIKITNAFDTSGKPAVVSITRQGNTFKSPVLSTIKFANGKTIFGKNFININVKKAGSKQIVSAYIPYTYFRNHHKEILDNYFNNGEVYVLNKKTKLNPNGTVISNNQPLPFIGTTTPSYIRNF